MRLSPFQTDSSHSVHFFHVVGSWSPMSSESWATLASGGLVVVTACACLLYFKTSELLTISRPEWTLFSIFFNSGHWSQREMHSVCNSKGWFQVLEPECRLWKLNMPQDSDHVINRCQCICFVRSTYIFFRAWRSVHYVNKCYTHVSYKDSRVLRRQNPEATKMHIFDYMNIKFFLYEKNAIIKVKRQVIPWEKIRITWQKFNIPNI